MPLLPQSIADLVARDRLPRQATADDQTQHVLYWDGIVRSMLASDWPPPLPTDPTEAEVAAAILAREQAVQQAQQAATALRQRIIQTAQSAVGVQFDQLTNIQLRALVAILLWKNGAIDNTGVVRPLAEWVK